MGWWLLMVAAAAMMMMPPQRELKRKIYALDVIPNTAPFRLVQVVARKKNYGCIKFKLLGQRLKHSGNRFHLLRVASSFFYAIVA